MFDASKNLATNLARMPFAVILAPEAVEDFRRLTANVRATVRIALETHLTHAPQKTSRSRIKRLRGIRRPQYRLRVDDVRVFYDIPARPSRFWRSWPNRRSRNGSHSSQIRNEASAAVGDQGRSVPLSQGSGNAGDRDNASRQAGGRADWL